MIDTNVGSLSPARLESVTGGTVKLPCPKKLPLPERCDPWGCDDMRRIEEILKQPQTQS